MSPQDVVILGGGLAGLALAHQLKRARPALRITVLEKATFPVREAAHKVGESTVEIAALYFANTLGLRDLCDAEHLPKLGLRFFFSDGANDDIAARSEWGPSCFMPVRTWQLDRGRFENTLAERAVDMGITLVTDAVVRDVTLGTPHRVSFRASGVDREISATWVVDTTGRRAVLRKQLKLTKPTRHDANAAWFRVPANLDIDTWSTDAAWRERVPCGRRLSTNHLIGDGYWVWLIPLASGSTSVGIVTDAQRHPFSAIRSEDAARTWLHAHEPQLAKVLDHSPAFSDFSALKNYSHNATRVFSPERWACVGDAAMFLDPFYSPGGDFIAVANTMLTEGILASLDGQADATHRIEGWNRRLLLMFRAFLPNFRRRYPLMGVAAPMRAKLVWDISTYWSTYALMFASGRLEDERFMERCDDLLRDLFVLNIEVQELLTRWGDAEVAAGTHLESGSFYDYATQPWLRGLNDKLLQDWTDDSLLEQLALHMEDRRSLAATLQAAALQRHPDLTPMPDPLPAAGHMHLGWLDLV